MAIKTSSQGTIPAVTLEYLQYNEFLMRVSEQPPHKISLTAKLRAYGVDNGEKIYSKDPLSTMNISNLDAYVGGLDPAKQAEALIGITKVQEGLGTLASIFYNLNFIGVE